MKYKNTFLTTAITASLITSSSAATLLIGDNSTGETVDTVVTWDGTGGTSGITTNTSPNGTVVTTVDGVTFTISVAATGDSGGSDGDIRVGGNGHLGVTGATGTPNTNTRIGDTETLKFTISTSGAVLGSLSLNTLKLAAFTSANNDVVSYTDGTNTGTHAAGSTRLSYSGGGTNNMANASLVALTKDNTATWEVTVSSTDNGTDAQDAFEVEHLIFDYTVVPEPSSTALLGLGGLALLLRRRK